MSATHPEPRCRIANYTDSSHPRACTARGNRRIRPLRYTALRRTRDRDLHAFPCSALARHRPSGRRECVGQQLATRLGRQLPTQGFDIDTAPMHDTGCVPNTTIEDGVGHLIQ